MDIDNITDLKVQLGQVLLSFSLNYCITLCSVLALGFVLKCVFSDTCLEKTSLILDEQHHLAVQSQQFANKALNTNCTCVSLTSGSMMTSMKKVMVTSHSVLLHVGKTCWNKFLSIYHDLCCFLVWSNMKNMSILLFFFSFSKIFAEIICCGCSYRYIGKE